jgi:hypothetical protein
MLDVFCVCACARACVCVAVQQSFAPATSSRPHRTAPDTHPPSAPFREDHHVFYDL